MVDMKCVVVKGAEATMGVPRLISSAIAKRLTWVQDLTLASTNTPWTSTMVSRGRFPMNLIILSDPIV